MKSGAIDVPSGVMSAEGDVVIKATNYNDSTVRLTIKGSPQCDVTAVIQPASSTIDSTNHTITANLTSSASSTPVEVATSRNSTWKLYSDPNCTSEISSNPMTLTPGHNIAYIRVTAQDGTSQKIYPLTIIVPAPPNSTISPGTATFDKYAGSANYRDVSVSMTLNGNTLTGITNGSTPLTAGTDYTVSGSGNNMITLNKNYLIRQNIGTTTLTFNFSAGDPQNLSITVVDNTPYLPPYTPTYTISISQQGICTFPAQTEGYLKVSAQSITVTKTGDGNIFNLQAALSGPNADSFTLGGLSAQNLDYMTPSAVFTVQPKDGLPTGTYTATVTVTASPGISQSFEVSFTVSPEQTREISVAITCGGGTDTVDLTVTRSVDDKGITEDILHLDEGTAEEIINMVQKQGSFFVTLNLTGSGEELADKIAADLSEDFISQLASKGISLKIQTEQAAFQLSGDLLSSIKNQDVTLESAQVNDSAEISQINDTIVQLVSGSEIIGRPVAVETNFSGRTQVTLPLDTSKFSSKDELDKYLSSLAVVVQHSDGENVVDKGTIEYDAEGNPTGISIWVNQFSTFTLVKLADGYFDGITTVMPDKVEADKEWHIKFSNEADPSTITKDNVYVTDIKGNRVDVNVSYGQDNILTVAPVNPYTSGESYYLYITKNVQSKGKMPLASAARYEFTVK